MAQEPGPGHHLHIKHPRVLGTDRLSKYASHSETNIKFHPLHALSASSMKASQASSHPRRLLAFALTQITLVITWLHSSNAHSRAVSSSVWVKRVSASGVQRHWPKCNLPIGTSPALISRNIIFLVMTILCCSGFANSKSASTRCRQWMIFEGLSSFSDFFCV